MATSGTITGSFNGSNAQYLTFRCDWSVTSQDLANKTSNVRLRWIVTKTTSNLYTNKSSTPWSQTCNGTTTSGSLSFNLGNVGANTDYVVRDVTVTIPHSADGTKNASINGTLDLSGTSAGTGTFSGSMPLPTIATTPPTVSSLTLSDVGTKPSGVSAYVAGYTKFRLTATATPVSPATISTYAFYNGNTLLQSGSSNVFTYSSANTAGSYTFKVIVTDSYGNSTPKTNSAVTVVAYSMPTITATTYRSNSSGTADGSGTYIQCSVTGTVANISGNKVASLVGNITPTIGSHTFATNANSPASGTWRPSGAATSTAYTVTYTVTDSFGSVATISQTVQSEFINFDLYPDSTYGGMGVGMTAESGLASFNMPIKPYQGIVAEATNDILASADAMSGDRFKTFTMNGSSYTGTVPDANYKYGTGFVIKRHNTSVTATIYPESGGLSPIYNHKNSSGQWTGWTSPSMPIALTGTAASGVTINNNSSYKVGNLVVINLRITLTAAKNMDTAIITGFPAPVSSLSSVGIIACACNRTDAAFAIMTDGTLATATSATARMYLISATYFTA